MVVDTPGVFDTNHSEDVVMNEITKCYGLTSPGPHAIIMVRRPDRFTDEERETIEIFHKHFGNDLFKYMIMVITNEGASSKQKSVRYMQKTMEIGDRRRSQDYEERDPTALLYSVIKMSGERYIPFDISSEGFVEEQQVKDLLDMIDSLVKENNGKYFTNANFQSVETCLESYMDQIKNDAKKEARRRINEVMDAYDDSTELTEILINDANAMEITGLTDFPSISYLPNADRVKQRVSRDDLEKVELIYAQTARTMKRGTIRNRARTDIQKEKKGIMWALRKVIKVLGNAFTWIKSQFCMGKTE